MENTSTELKSKLLLAISKPIQLLALCSVIFEFIIAYVVSSSKETDMYSVAVYAAIGLPILLLLIISVLIAFFHDKLYAPKDYHNADDFISVLQRSSENIKLTGELDSKSIFKPLDFSSPLSPNKKNEIRKSLVPLEEVLDQFRAENFSTLHSWYNEEARHELALLCADIAIAKGQTNSQNFSFRAASLRKLGRFNEAKFSALFALELNPENIDAVYNISKAYALLNAPQQAKQYAQMIEDSGQDRYIQKLRIFLKAYEKTSNASE